MTLSKKTTLGSKTLSNKRSAADKQPSKDKRSTQGSWSPKNKPSPINPKPALSQLPNSTSTILTPEALAKLTRRQLTTRCGGCDNHCRLTISIFNDGRRFVSGNRCERGAGLPLPPASQRIPNLYESRLARLFDPYPPLDLKAAPRGIIGIPRVLNVAFEHYPLWFTFFTELGFRVLLSPRSTKEIFNAGLPTVTSDVVCYPAKMVNGHIRWLLDQKVPAIFYPAVVYEQREFSASNNHFNCPVVTGYPEVIKHSFSAFKNGNPKLIAPFLNLAENESVTHELTLALATWKISAKEIARAWHKGLQELRQFKKDQREQGAAALQWLAAKENRRGIVLAGRPYHLDPEVNKGLAKILIAEGIAVLTEDSIAHLGKIPRPLRVLDQWAFHSRVYAAASFVATQPRLDFVQLNSFGCGLDAIVVDQAREIIEANGKIFTVLKIDEGSNLGAIRIRLRSLKNALLRRPLPPATDKPKYSFPKGVSFQKADQKKRTILCPQLSPPHFALLEAGAQASGYKFKLLNEVSKKDLAVGLKMVNNDACYPAIITVGQLLNALEEGHYRSDEVAMIMSQTGGACRASNYIALIKKALADAGRADVPLLSLNALGWEKHPGFKFTPAMINRALIALVLGDLLNRLSFRQLPYEKNPGEVKQLTQEFLTASKKVVVTGKLSTYQRLVKKITRAFAAVPIDHTKRVPRVGIVGEILVKFHPDANHHLVDYLQAKGVEVCLPDLVDFFLYSTYDDDFKYAHLGGTRAQKYRSWLTRSLIELYRAPVRQALEKFGRSRFTLPVKIEHLVELATPTISPGMCSGEGWFLTAEMVELIENDFPNILCLQPFACLPNHIVGRGMLGALRERFPGVNLAALDYDPGTSEVANHNRIELFLAQAWKQLK